MALRFSPTRGAASLVLNSLVRGPQGEVATVDVGTVTTLNAGGTPTVTNSGTNEEATLDFGIPRGADSGLRFLFESSTTMDAPASGGIRLNNAALSSVSAIAINAVDADGLNIRTFASTWGDSTNTVKGYLILRKEGSGAAVGVFSLSSVTDNTTWLQIAVTAGDTNGSLSASDVVYLTPLRVGDKGTDGQVAGPGASIDGEIALFSGTGGATLKRAATSGILKAASGVLSAAVSSTDYAPATSGSAILKGNGSGGFSSASAGTDYAPATSGSAILKGNGSGGFSSAAAGTDYVAATSGSAVQKANGSGGLTAATSSDFVSPSATSTLTAGYTATSTSGGTITGSNQSYTPTPGTSVQNIQHLTLNGSSLTGTFTFSPPGSECSAVVEITNGGSGSVAATLSTSGFTKVTGDTYAGTNANKYLFYCLKSKNYSHLHIQALQ